MQFYKAINGVRELLRYSQLESINASLLLKISDVFIKRYIQNQVHEADPDRDEGGGAPPVAMDEFLRHKSQLYHFYDQVTEKISDYKIWRLICRVKGSLKEPIEEVKQLKMKELNCMMKISWNVDIETCELVERTLGELINDFFSKCPPSEEEKSFVRNTAMIIEQTLHRPC